ncbi:hypothetical protein ACHAXA_009979 [Cyclostephanos tholiformis]|uniref:Uncharacterized protein n=1 Tax=Cyclostephanos tholiformis TaxID=382380 RepID=A0ABD3R1Q4_9STRA
MGAHDGVFQWQTGNDAWHVHHCASSVDMALVYFNVSLAGCNLVNCLLANGEPVLGCAGGGLMIKHLYVREHAVSIDGTEDSTMGLTKDLMERLLRELSKKLDGAK